VERVTGALWGFTIANTNRHGNATQSSFLYFEYFFKGSFLVDEEKDGMLAPKKVKASSQLQ
jgi:hypothetical protein